MLVHAAQCVLEKKLDELASMREVFTYVMTDVCVYIHTYIYIYIYIYKHCNACLMRSLVNWRPCVRFCLYY
jgi:hypothetical protein